ncbi:MAG TPA: cupin domain-containing protein [Gemmataceae bacterium]|nr:cupin domain-containing protein [Gemmataceae bacterium]
MTEVSNIFANIPHDRLQELSETLVASDVVRIERIVSFGHISPPGFWYDQDTNEWVLLLQGAAELRFEDEAALVRLSTGDCCNIPAHRRHRVEWTDMTKPTIWLAVHYR